MGDDNNPDKTNDTTLLKNIPTTEPNNVIFNNPILKEVNLGNKQDNFARTRIKKSQIALA